MSRSASQSARVLVGTSGYSYPPWKQPGRFYPPKIRSADMLAFYAGRLPTVELNHTFYTPPEPGTLAPLVAQVPDSFRFAVKAPQRITHHLRLKDVEPDVKQLLAAAAELGPRLGPLLFQLPHNMKKDAARLADLLGLLPPRREVAFEFRHASWFDDEIFDLLRRNKRALCVAETEDLVTPRVATTSWGYLRLREERYGKAALVEWASWIAAQPWSRSFVYFMHEDTARGPRYAKQLGKLLSPSGE